MDFPSVINRIDIFACSLNSLIAVSFFVIAMVDRRRCFNASIVLSCNTALGIFLFSFTNTAMAVYMFLWDHDSLLNVDNPCPIRAFFHHSPIASIHHAFILQAIEKYCKTLQIRMLRTRLRQVCFVSIQ